MNRIFNSDFVIINLNNNGCAWIETEHNSWETNFSDGQAIVAYAQQNGYTCKSYVRYTNNDVRIIMN